MSRCLFGGDGCAVHLYEHLRLNHSEMFCHTLLAFKNLRRWKARRRLFVIHNIYERKSLSSELSGNYHDRIGIRRFGRSVNCR